MKKTFYAVTYRALGADRPATQYFRTKAEADEFAKRDYADSPVRVTTMSENKIRMIEWNIDQQ